MVDLRKHQTKFHRNEATHHDQSSLLDCIVVVLELALVVPAKPAVVRALSQFDDFVEHLTFSTFSLVLSLGSLRVWRHNPRLDACGASCCAPGVHAEIWKP